MSKLETCETYIKLRISVVTPVYNREDCVVRCLESVAAENCGGGRVEHILADDGSTDRSAEIVERFAATHPDVRLVRLPRNMGPNAARNAAIAAASGDFVLFIDSDDSLAPGAVEFIEAVMDREPGYDQYLFACSHNRDAISSYGDRHIFSYSDFLSGQILFDFAHLINRHTLLEYPFDESLRIHEYLFHLRFYRKAGKILFINHIVSLVDTTRTDHVTFTTRKTNDRALAESRIYTRLFIEWFGDDLAALPEGALRLTGLLNDSYSYAVLSGDYTNARDIRSRGARPALLYRVAAITRTGRMMWSAVKIAMSIKWRIRDALSRK